MHVTTLTHKKSRETRFGVACNMCNLFHRPVGLAISVISLCSFFVCAYMSVGCNESDNCHNFNNKNKWYKSICLPKSSHGCCKGNWGLTETISSHATAIFSSINAA